MAETIEFAVNILCLWRVCLNDVKVMLTSLRLDSPVSDNNNWPLELVLEMLNDLASNLAEVEEGPVWDSDQDVLLHISRCLLKFNLFS